MAKGNLFLGFGRGKVGDVVFSRADGEQITRARNRAPRNPQTPLQLLQRVVLKTSSAAFSLMQDICNHSFQGAEGVTYNQARFNQANVKKFREQLATEINSGDPDVILTSSETNFSPKGAQGACINPYVISEGKLPAIVGEFDGDEETPSKCVCVFSGITGIPFTLTYAQLVDKLGLQRGDQLTAVILTCDDTLDGSSAMFNGFHYGRFVLEPDDGDMTHTISDSTHWNAKTSNWSWTSIGESSKLGGIPLSAAEMMANGATFSVAAYGVIVSRLVGATWSRSDAKLTVRPWTVGTTWHLAQDHGDALLSDALLSFMSDDGSLLYLNQAET